MWSNARISIQAPTLLSALAPCQSGEGGKTEHISAFEDDEARTDGRTDDLVTHFAQSERASEQGGIIRCTLPMPPACHMAMIWADGQAGAGAAEMATPFEIPGTHCFLQCGRHHQSLLNMTRFTKRGYVVMKARGKVHILASNNLT